MSAHGKSDGTVSEYPAGEQRGADTGASSARRGAGRRPSLAGMISRSSLTLLAMAASTLGAQQPLPTPPPTVKAALDAVRTGNAWTLDQQVSICEIAAPPFKEQQRAAEMKRRFESLGLRAVRIDSVGNVIAERPGSGSGPTVLFSAHLDTVFPEGTDVHVRRDGDVYRAPGIGDDCRGLAVLLAVARAMRDAQVTTAGNIVFVANVGEEGPGNLRGMRYLFAHPPAHIDYFVAIDGTGLGITYRAVGSNRYKVSFKGPGGHSYGAFGMPSPIHALGRAIAKICRSPGAEIAQDHVQRGRDRRWHLGEHHFAAGRDGGRSPVGVA